MKFDILHNFISPVTGRVLSDRDYVLVGDREGIATPSPLLIDIKLDIQKLDEEIKNINDLSSNATYILQTPNEHLPNAQSLIDTGLGIPKITDNGVLAIASAGGIPVLNDYVDPTTLISSIDAQAIKTTAEIGAAIAAQAAITTEEIATSATATLASAAAASIAHFELAMTPYSIGIVGTGLQIQADINSKLESAKQYARDQDALLTVDLIGDVTGGGFLSSPILTTFIHNPKFYGSEAIQIPYGSTIDRPNSPSIGMLRYNTDVGLEYYNNSTWAHIASNPVQIGIPYATDMVYGVINNMNGIFDGFASLERDLDIRIKTSYYTGELNDSSSASLSLLDRYNNGYINKTISSNTGYFDYLLQKQDDGIKTDLLKFDNKIDEFIFHKPISYNGKNIIKYDEAVDIVTGVLNNSNGLFSGFATDNQEIDIKIKTAHFAEDDYSSSSLSFLNRYNNGYIFSNKTNSNWSNDFSFNAINNEIKTELFKYDGLSNKFVFNKLVEVPYPINDDDAANKYYVDNAAAGVKEVLGTTGQIFSSGGQYPQISLLESGVSSRSYKLADVTFDVFGRAISASDGQAVTQISTGYGLTGGIITDTGTIGLSSSGVFTGTYTNANITVDYAGRILSASNSNSIENVTFYGNTISTNSWNGHIVIDPNYAGGNGDIYLNADTKIENGSYLRLYDNSNEKYTEIKSPSNYSQSSTWILPTTQGYKDQFIKMGDYGQLEWTTIVTDAGVTSITAGSGLTGGTITSTGTIGLSSTGVSAGTYTNPTLTIDGAGRITSASNGQSSNLGNFQFSGDTMYTSGGSGQMNISNIIVNFAGGISTGGGVSMSGFGSSGFIWVASDGSLQYTGPNGTTKLAN